VAPYSINGFTKVSLDYSGSTLKLNVTSYIIQTFKEVGTSGTTTHEPMFVSTENVIIIKMV